MMSVFKMPNDIEQRIARAMDFFWFSRIVQISRKTAHVFNNKVNL